MDNAVIQLLFCLEMQTVSYTETERAGTIRGSVQGNI